MRMFSFCRILFLLNVLLLASCGKQDDYTAYFGGEINNPQAPYVILSRGNNVVDTIPLDKNNRFFIKFDSLTPGMYRFQHEPDYQYVYFDKNDSIMVSVNTANFDRSIMFRGKGEEKNNFMIDLFLLQEEDRNKSFYQYDHCYKQFRKSIDSTYALRKAFYERSKKKINWSSEFDFFAKARLDFNYFTKKEYYPFVHFRRTGHKVDTELPADYYSHRKNINFNDKELVNFSPFVRYLNAMLYNMSITRGIKGNNNTENILRDNIAKLTIADSMFSNESIKNDVLNNIAFSYLLEDQDLQNNQKFLEHYMRLSTDNSENNEIRKIGKAISLLKKGNKLPGIALVSTENKPFSINNGRKTVLYFWTTCARMHYEMADDKAAQLKKQFPDIDFIAINVDDNAEWQKLMKRYTFKNTAQLRAANFQELKEKWAFNRLNRTIILNADGTINDAFTNLMDTNFSTKLK